MLSYIVKKLLLACLLVVGVISLIFVLVELSPGTAADRFITPEMSPEMRGLIEAKWHLNDPWWVRYLAMLKNLAMGNLGQSMITERAVSDVILEKLPNTLWLSLVSIVLIQGLGIGLGVLQAVRQYSWVDAMASLLSLFFYSMPSFWLALMLQLIFALWWPILPSSDMTDAVMHDYMSPGEQLIDRLKHMVLPSFALGVASAAGVARYMRSSLLEVIRQDYIRTARAKGLPERTVILKHALRNALLPIITILGLQLPFLVSGAVLVENIFSWPGMGRLIVDAIFQQDTPTIIGCLFVLTLMVVIGNLLADLLYALVDPRIRLEG